MSEFFVHYPQISYDISGTKPAKVKTVINLMERAKLKNIVWMMLFNIFLIQ